MIKTEQKVKFISEFLTNLHGASEQTLYHHFIGEQKVYFHFFKRHERYNQEVLSHSFICLPLPYMEGIVLICNTDLYCVIAQVTCSIGDIFTH